MIGLEQLILYFFRISELYLEITRGIFGLLRRCENSLLPPIIYFQIYASWLRGKKGLGNISEKRVEIQKRKK